MLATLSTEESYAYAGFIQELVKTSQIKSEGHLCVLGSDEISSIILQQDSKAMVLNERMDRVNECKAVYIAHDEQKTFKIGINKFIANKVLTVAIFDGFTEMGGFVQVQLGRRSFELIINARELKNSGIRLSALAMNLVIN